LRHFASDEAADWSGADPAADQPVEVIPSATVATDFSVSKPIAGNDGDDIERGPKPGSRT
jgi:hypothetical protein